MAFTPQIKSLVSTLNSSTTPLGIGGVFTGPAEDVSEYNTVTVTVFSDVVSAASGLQMQDSSNGTNWDNANFYDIPAGTGKTFKSDVNAKFFRLVYTNGGVAQTTFRLSVLYSLTGHMGSSIKPSDGRSIQNDMREGVSYIAGFNGTTLDMLRSDIANGLDVDVTRLPALPVGTNVIGALVANQSVNNAQVNGVAVSTGTGVSNTGVQRVVVATDIPLPALSELRSATLHVTATAAVNTAITATLPAPAAGLFHYITSVELVKLYAVIGVASGAGVVITSSNLPGSPAWLTEQIAGAVGSAPKVITYTPTTPLKSSVAATATTFVAPAQLQTIWRWNISYFTAA